MKIRILIAGIAFFALSCNDNSTKEQTPEAATPPAVQQSESDNSASSLMALPSFRLRDVKGNEVQLQNLKGKKLFVNLWASWCPPCKREMPSIEKLYQSLDTAKVQFVLLSLDDQFEKAKDYVAGNKLDLPIFYPAEDLPALFNVQGIPATFIFDENGALIKRVDGMDDYDTRSYRDMLK